MTDKNNEELPMEAPLPSGKILLRIPKSLHAALIVEAAKENISLNQYMMYKLSLPAPIDRSSDELLSPKSKDGNK